MRDNQQVEAFEAPVDQLEMLLGYSLAKERSALGALCGLMQVHRPRKIVKIGGMNDIDLLAVLKCMQMLDMDSQVYVVEQRKETDVFTVILLRDLKEKLRKCNLEFDCFKILCDHTFAAWRNTIGNEIDFLLLDAVDNMPEDVLGFIAAYPYLSDKAVVALYEAEFICSNTNVSRSILTSTVRAEMMDLSLECDRKIGWKIPSISQYTMSAFKVNADTAVYMKDLFVLLKARWNHVPSFPHMIEYIDLIIEKYGADYFDIYWQILFGKDAYWSGMKDMVHSIFSTFPYILLYGKSERGQSFLKAAKLFGVNVKGFIVSDGRNTSKNICGLPIYSYSEIPFCKEELLIIQTSGSQEITKMLEDSDYHWFKFSENFWEGVCKQL